MIEKIKTITYQIRSHGQVTVLSDKGMMIESDWEDYYKVGEWGKPNVKRMIWHLEDVLKCMNRIKKEEAEKKMKNSQDDISKP